MRCRTVMELNKYAEEVFDRGKDLYASLEIVYVPILIGRDAENKIEFISGVPNHLIEVTEREEG
jgi:hypothetical protein